MMFIFTLLGQAAFATKFLVDEDGRRPRAHFDDFVTAFLSIFQVLSGENWNSVMYDGMKAVGWWGSLFFVGVVLLGNFVIFNLFLAILMGKFEEQSALMRERAELLSKRRKTRVLALAMDVPDGEEEGEHSNGMNGGPRAQRLRPGEDEDGPGPASTVEDKGPAPPIRLSPPQLVARFVEWSVFVQVITMCIGLSCIVMVHNYKLRDPRGGWYRGFEILDVVLVAIFTVEMCLKVFAYGLICGKHSYLRSGWNVLDGFVVVICILDYAVTIAGVGEDSPLGSLKTLRVLRALR